MSVCRVNKNDNYTTMSNYHLRDKRLSLKAIGLLSKVLSLPDDWDYSISGLVAICKEQRSSVETALKELKEYGYLIVDKLMPNETESGRIEYVYNFYENPKQEVEKQGVDFQGVENHEQLNTKELNTKELNIYSRVVDELNAVCETHYKATTNKTKRLIDARLKEGFTENDFFNVIAKKASTWKGTEMEKYLRPETLFGTKFEGYLNEKIASKNPFLDMLNERKMENEYR